ncbi:MAG TPA: phosphohydrolase [Anaerolineaceae bacterium]|jgi:putative hydrolase of HD superfamily|nr:phosphohydrolase [Anaerolineaceae bacterium]
MEENNPFLNIIDFIGYIDQLKHVTRKNALHDRSREENTAEHSWHAALSALLLAPYADQPVDVNKVVKMLLIHDLVEIEAGDTFVYDSEEVAKQEPSEAEAADIILSKLPEQQGEMLQNLWDEFEARVTPEAKFAKAIDRFLPLYSNIVNHGYSWLPYDVTHSHVREIGSIIKDGSTGLWELVEDMLDEAVQDGYLNP